MKVRKLRIAAGLTQQQLGDQVFVSNTRIAQIELATDPPGWKLTESLDNVLGAEGALTELWPLIGLGPYEDWAAKFLELQGVATAVHEFSQTVPGLAQTEGYARALLSDGQIFNEGDLETKVAARLKRQHVLDGPTPPWFWMILDEAVLRRTIGGPQVLADQLSWLLELGRRPRVHIQVLPLRKPVAAAVGGSLSLLMLPEGHQIAYTEGIHSGRIVEDPHDVARYAVVYDRLQANALPPEESAALIRDVMEEHYSCAPQTDLT
jgi:transcriptional regulator with XRE-family HTH domain